MAASSMTEDASSPRSARRGAQVLALAYFLVFATLFALAGGVALFGNPHASDPVVHLDLRLKRVARAAPPAPPPPVQTPQQTAALPAGSAAPLSCVIVWGQAMACGV